MKILNKRIALIFFVVFIFQPSFCQENYLPGYIIRLSGDTLLGSVDYRNWEKNPNKILFKTRGDESVINYTPIDIKGFGVLDEIYESAIVETEVSPFKTEDLQHDYELMIRIDTTFLQTMIRGTKCLYYYKNKSGQEQFYIRKDSSYELLIHKKYLKEQEGQTIIAENKKYIGQLTIYLNDCPSLQKKLNALVYQKNSLENLFLFYYKCTQTGIKFQKKTEKPFLEFGVVAGMTMTSLKSYSDDYGYVVITSDFTPSINFSAGLFLEVIFPRNQAKWSLCNELSFSPYHENCRYEEFEQENKYEITYTNIGFAYLKLNNLLRFRYPVGAFSLFVSAGLSNGYAFLTENYKKTELQFYTIERVEEGKAIEDNAGRYEIEVIGGTGARYKNFSFEFRYERALGYSTNRYYCLLGYRF
jgi:hypothetical protein